MRTHVKQPNLTDLRIEEYLLELPSPIHLDPTADNFSALQALVSQSRRLEAKDGDDGPSIWFICRVRCKALRQSGFDSRVW